jgi:hypothetical protein
VSAGQRPGPHVKVWLQLFEDYLQREGINLDDAGKISFAKSFLDRKEGNAYELLTTLPDFREAKDWSVFKKDVTHLFYTDQESQLLTNFESLINLEWEKNTPLTSFATILAREAEKFKFAYRSKEGEECPEKMVRLICYHKIRHHCQKKYQKMIDDSLNLGVKFIEMIGNLGMKDIALQDGTCLVSKQNNQQQSRNTYTKNVRVAQDSKPKPQFPPKRQEKPQPQPQQFRANRRSPPSDREGFNPNHRCTNCERIGHWPRLCPLPPWCGHCKKHHKRGTQEACRNSSWDWENGQMSYSLPDIYKWLEQKKARPSGGTGGARPNGAAQARAPQPPRMGNARPIHQEQQDDGASYTIYYDDEEEQYHQEGQPDF